MHVKVFLIIAAALACLTGAVLLLAPGQFYAPTGLRLTPILATIAQAHGATLVGLGVLTFLARNLTGPGLTAVLSGNLLVQLLSLLVALRTQSLGIPALPPIILHAVLGALFAYFLLRRGAAAAA